MDLQNRIALLEALGRWLLSEDESWREAKENAFLANPWFTSDFSGLAAERIARQFLDGGKLRAWIAGYGLPETNPAPKTVGLVMAGNIPLVGFHDLLCVFASGHRQRIKLSSKDTVLTEAVVRFLIAQDARAADLIVTAPMLKGCDAYIATGSNNSARYFDYYFGKYPHIIRRNRTSVAMLTGEETPEQLEALADDVFLYYGLGCRNVTKLMVPLAYDFVPLLGAFRKYARFADHTRYRNNYDYQLALLILNKAVYMSNDNVILVQQASPFSPISVVHYEYYLDRAEALAALRASDDIQCVAGTPETPFGTTQNPALGDYADGVDTLQFLQSV